MAAPPQDRLVRRLRLTVVGLAMLVAVCLLAVGGVLLYWHLYLLEPSPGTFSRGPFLTRLDTTSAALRYRVRGSGAVTLRALGPDGTPVVARGGRSSGLAPGTGYAWVASVDGVARASGSFQTAPRELRTPVRLVVIGDYGSGNDHEWAVGRVAAAQDPAFVLT